MKDTSNEPRSDADIIEAKKVITKKFISMAGGNIPKDDIQLMMTYPVVIEALDELLHIRKLIRDAQKKQP